MEVTNDKISNKENIETNKLLKYFYWDTEIWKIMEIDLDINIFNLKFNTDLLAH